MARIRHGDAMHKDNVRAAANHTYDNSTSGLTATTVQDAIDEVAAPGGSDVLVTVSSNDTTAGYLNGKLVAGSGITLTENNDGGDETLTIDATGGGGGSGLVGYAPYAYTLNLSPENNATTATLPANGGSITAPVFVPSALLLQSCTFRCTGSAAQAAEWRLYEAGNTSTVSAITGADGSDTWSIATNHFRTIAASGAPVTLDPGVYWLVFRNTHASNTLGVNGANITSITAAPNFMQTQTLGSALPSSLDMVTGWTKAASGVYPLFRLDGSVFGQGTAY